MTAAQHWISAFLEALSADLGASGNTLLAYGRDLRQFDDWRQAQGLRFETLAQGDIEAYLVACDAGGLSRATRARRLSAIRQLFRFAFEEGWRADNPALRLRGPGGGGKLPGTLSEAEVGRAAEGRPCPWANRGRTPAHRLPDRADLCHRSAGQRAGQPAGCRGPGEPAHGAGDGQGRTGANGAPVAACP